MRGTPEDRFEKRKALLIAGARKSLITRVFGKLADDTLHAFLTEMKKKKKHPNQLMLDMLTLLERHGSP